MPKEAKCKLCGRLGHYKYQCFGRPRKPILPVNNKTKKKHLVMRREWFALNPPDENGYWYCYLKISTECSKKMIRGVLTLEHVEAKVRRPDLIFDVDNIKPACGFCNKLKGSRSLTELSKIWPHLLGYNEDIKREPLAE